MRLIYTLYIVFILLALTFVSSAQEKEKDIKLLQSAFDGDIGAVIQALKDTADINSTTALGVSPLIFAAQQGHEDMVKILVHNGANIDHKSHDSVNALLAASIFNHVEIVRFLAEKGLSVNSHDNRGITPMHYAAAYGYAAMFQLLYAMGADPECRDEQGNSPLMSATYIGNTFMVDSLIRIGANVNTRDSAGLSPLMIAAMKQYNDIAMLLLGAGADLNMISFKGTSALSLAVATVNYQLTDSLLSRGAVIPKDSGTVDPVLLTYQYELCAMSNHLRKKGIKLPVMPVIKNSFLSFTPDFNHTDFMIGPELGLFDRRYRLEGSIGFKTRITAKRVLIVDEDEDELQYFESRQNFFISLRKHFSLSKRSAYPTVFIGIEEHYTVGKYSTGNKSYRKFLTQPVAGIQWKNNPYSSFSMGMRYAAHDIKNIFPLRFFASYTFYFDLINKKLDNNPRNDWKKINWLY